MDSGQYMFQELPYLLMDFHKVCVGFYVSLFGGMIHEGFFPFSIHLAGEERAGCLLN